jgi:hypothetical protein
MEGTIAPEIVGDREKIPSIDLLKIISIYGLSFSDPARAGFFFI